MKGNYDLLENRLGDPNINESLIKLINSFGGLQR